jgi:hypothetical protein
MHQEVVIKKDMKKKVLIMGYVLALFMLSACRKEYKEIGDLPSKVDGLTASWVLSSCEVLDKGGIIEETIDVTPFFQTKSKLPNVSFTMESGVGTYSCDTSNIAFQFFGGTAGKWRFDNEQYPTKIILIPNGGVESIVLPLGSTIRPTDTYLKLDKAVLCGGEEKSVYRLSFIRN